MEPSKGLVVRAMAGRDRGGYFVVVDAAEGFAWIADGKRPMEDVTDKKLRNMLKQYG